MGKYLKHTFHFSAYFSFSFKEKTVSQILEELLKHCSVLLIQTVIIRNNLTARVCQLNKTEE